MLYTDGYNILNNSEKLTDLYEDYQFEEKENISQTLIKNFKTQIKSILKEFSKREDILSHFKIINFFSNKSEKIIFRSLLVI